MSHREDFGDASSSPDPAIRPYLAEFSDPDLESDYRRAHLGEDARALFVLMMIVLPAHAIWLISDYLVAASGTSFGLMATIRAVIIVTGILVILVTFRTRSPRVFSAAVLITAVISAAGILFFDLTRPSDYLGHYTIDIIVIIALYFAVPLPVRLQATCSALYSFALLGIYFSLKESVHTNLYNFTIPLSVVISNAVGYLASRNLAIRRRREYFLFHRESEARTQLQHALDNIRTLSGLLPICAGCKKIRDDKGYWNHVEAYLAARSEVAFTHGLCPDCSNSYRAELERID